MRSNKNFSPKKETSTARADAARRNGTKSRGPKIPAGKQKSSQNAVKHGACSRRTSLLLVGEDPHKLQQITDAFYHHICPVNLAEAALVDTMIVQVWKTARVNSYETECLTSDAEDLHASLHGEYDVISSTRLFALAFQKSAIVANTPLALRYLVACRNMFRSALADLARLRQMRGNRDAAYLQPPRVESANDAICINTSGLAVPDLPPGKVTTPPQEAAPAATPAPEPEPEPEPAPEPVIDPPCDPPPLEEPYLPMRDETGAIWLTCLGTPMMTLNQNWPPENGVQRPRGFMYTLDFFRGERFNTRIVYSNSLDPRIDARGYLRNEPNDPVNPYKTKRY